MNRFILFFIACAILLLVFISPPDNFQAETVVHVDTGESLRSISKVLQEEKVIRSRVLFETLVILFGREKSILPGDYLFKEKMSVFEVAGMFGRGARSLKPVKVTIPEGFDVRDIAQTFDAKLQGFSAESFLRKAEKYEGQLFPDTYFFSTVDTEDEVLKYMLENFEKKFDPLRPEIASLGKTEKQILVMASIIEREADGDQDRAMISGILWKRFSIGMPLQADAAPSTYERTGLPEDPIANPGFASIKAAMYPRASNYLYYIHDRSGKIYYARNFDEHRQNIQKYLK